MDEIFDHQCPSEVPKEFFALPQQVRRIMSVFQSREQSREALHLVKLEEMFDSLDGLIHRASLLVSGKEKFFGLEVEPVVRIGKLSGLIGTDEFSGMISKVEFGVSEVKYDEKLSLLKVAAVIENSMKTGAESIDLRGKLKNMVNLVLSSNHFTCLPDTMGDLTKLKTLNAETNELEELPYTIGNCCSLTELRLDFNNHKGLLEAVGKLECLEFLTLHYNRVKSLPTTMGNLLKLKEIDASFNELECIPESLCFTVQLNKINTGKDFVDLRALPKSIGNLEMLEELDISDDQIRALSDSFSLLSKLRVFLAHETPL
ncbi:Plant intracellular Ras-group-related LRR protein 5 [Linum perenne]